MVMLIKPVLSLFTDGFGLGAADMGANGSFCTEKSNRLDDARLGVGAAEYIVVFLVAVAADAFVVLYADARPNGSAEAAPPPRRSPIASTPVEDDPPPKSSRSMSAEGAANVCGGAAKEEPPKRSTVGVAFRFAFSASASILSSSKISSSCVFW